MGERKEEVDSTEDLGKVERKEGRGAEGLEIGDGKKVGKKGG